MKRIVIAIINIVLITSMLTMNVYAKPYNPSDYTSVEEKSALLPKGIKENKVSEHAQLRGDFFMGAD